MNPIVVIPSRLASVRLPGKPLAEIGGRAMVLHVLDRAVAAGIGPAVVACGDAAIAEAVRAAGGMAVITEPGLPRGTDRVHAALAEVDPERRHDVVVNLQGDLPTIDPACLRAVVTPLAAGFDIGTLVGPMAEGEAAAASVVKAVCAFESEVAPVLYFSRAPVPWGDGPLWHHVGVYAFRRAALDRFVALPESPLERRESLEQLRALEAGMRIGAVRVAHAPRGVDTPEDLSRVRAAAP